jgi:ABC-type multidrug transport system permease subunit
VKRYFTDMNATLRGFLIIALIALVVVVLSLQSVLATVGGLLRIAFFLAIAFFLFLVWRERRGDLEAWSEWNRKLFYAAVVLAVVAIGLWLGYGLPASRDALALVLVVAACAYVIVRVWRIEHRY